MTSSAENGMPPAQVAVLAALAGIRIPPDRAPSIAVRIAALRDGAALVASLPLREVEPAAVFLPALLSAGQSD